MTASDPVGDSAILDEVFRGGLEAQYQPIVDLASGEPIGYEALARLPAMPDVNGTELVDAARRAGRAAEIEWLCREAAVHGALDADLDPSMALFVNAEPSVLGVAPPHVAGEIGRALRELRVVVELTERDLLDDPAGLLRLVDSLRARGIGIALDDVGRQPESLALLEFLRPDVIKLDLELIQSVPTIERVQTLLAVMAYSEHTPVHLLAEGIETEEHLSQARALGATLGQGWLFGAAAPIVQRSATSMPLVLQSSVPDVLASPHELLARQRRTQVGPQPLILALTRDIEMKAASELTPPVVLATFQRADMFEGATRAQYTALATKCPLVAVFGVGFDRAPAPGVRGVAIAADDALAREWTVAVLGAHYAVALISREVDADSPDVAGARLFEFVLTHDRVLVAAVCRSMLTRMTAEAREEPSTVAAYAG
jgi:EAL domain-containing protein (putative c-di-GMP-specific phosphodiesterase class I)